MKDYDFERHTYRASISTLIRDWIKRYFLWRYQSIKNDEPWLTAAGAYNLQRQKNKLLRRGTVEEAQKLENDIDVLLSSLKPTSPETELERGIILPDVHKHKYPERNDIEVYWVDVVFLVKCWRWLVQGAGNPTGLMILKNHAIPIEAGPEWACLVTGLHLAGARLLTEMVPVRYAHQSVGGVALDLSDFHQTLRGLQNWGFSLHAIFHSHRFNGPVSPSSTDLDTQRNVLEPTYPAIQAVFSEDGYIRFFSVERSFDVIVFGKGVECVGQNHYRLGKALLKSATAEDIWNTLAPTR